MRILLMLPFAYVAGVDGFDMLAPYVVAVVLTACVGRFVIGRRGRPLPAIAAAAAERKS